jgi:hypothetical protein
MALAFHCRRRFAEWAWNASYWRAKRTFGLGVVAESLGLSGGDLLEFEPASPPRAGFFVNPVEVQVVPEA